MKNVFILVSVSIQVYKVLDLDCIFWVSIENSDVDSEASRRLIRVQSKSRFALPYSWPNIDRKSQELHLSTCI